MKLKTLNEWLNESNQGFLEPTKGNLRKYGLDPNKVTINPDGSIDYDGDVDLHNKSLTSIPFNFNKVKGKFDCSWNQLVNLVGGPEKVEGSFDCQANQLFSLEGSPKVVKGDFNCSFNHLISLKDAPKMVEWDFYCHANPILYNPTWYVGTFNITSECSIRDSSGQWRWKSDSDHLRMAFGRVGELSREEIIGIEEGLKKVDMPDDLRRYSEKELYKAQVKYNPKTKTQKFFHDLEMDDDLLGVL